jgi:hypothetical protein
MTATHERATRLALSRFKSTKSDRVQVVSAVAITERTGIDEMRFSGRIDGKSLGSVPASRVSLEGELHPHDRGFGTCGA